MDPQIKEALDKLGKTVAEFQAANNESIEQIRKKGVADAVTAEKVEKASAAIDALKDEIKALEARSREMENSINRPQLGNGGEKPEDLHKNAIAFFNASSRTGQIIHNVNDQQIEEYTNYRRAYNNYLRFPADSREFREVQNAMSVGSNPDGGFWAPTEMLNTIVKRLFESSPMRQVANVIPISRQDVEFPKDVNSGTSGGWVGEMGTRPVTATPQVGMQKITAHEQYAQPEVTQQFLDDAAIDVETWLAEKIADILARTENTAFVTGNGVACPRGFLSYGTGGSTAADDARAWGVLQYVVSGASGAFPTVSGLVADDANPLISLVHTMKQSYRQGAVWMMNRGVAGTIRKLRDANGRYLWTDSLVLGQPDRLLNYQVVEAEDMPDLSSDSFSIAFGNFKVGYTIADRIGLRTLRDPLTNKPFVRFYSTKRVGGDVVNFDAIKLLKFGTS
jgi:HK97 family phage major capsid protein